MKKLSLIIALMAIVISGYAKGLALKVYNPGANAIFPVTSTIVYGRRMPPLSTHSFRSNMPRNSSSRSRD